jgi:tetraacyldisaccharide 4'-kinase
LLASDASEIPVVRVGNLTVGGTGKTPFSAWLVARLRSAGERPAVVLRGYGEDEILVHQELNAGEQVIPAKRRVDGVRAAHAAGCTVAVLDDGFQHRAIRRDLDIVLVSVEAWLAVRPHLLPRGPWREPLRSVRRADLVVTTRKSATEAERGRVLEELRERIGASPAVVACDLLPTHLVAVSTGERSDPGMLTGTRVLAVAGLADPEPFACQLEALGAEVELVTFPDHHRYTRADAEALRERAHDRAIVMTLKDAVKLRNLLPAEAKAYVVHQSVVTTPALDQALSELLKRLERPRS